MNELTDGRRLLLLAALALFAFGGVDGGVDGGTGPAPIAAPGFRVLVLRDRQAERDLPHAQLSAIQSSEAEIYLDAHCENGRDGWRAWDANTPDASITEDAVWKSAFARAMVDSAGKRPWLLVSNGRTGVSGAFPSDEPSYLALLKKYGGK